MSSRPPEDEPWEEYEQDDGMAGVGILIAGLLVVVGAVTALAWEYLRSLWPW